MRGGDGGLEDRAQERASVGHHFKDSASRDLMKTWHAGYPSDCGKRKPPQGLRGF
jgi:hypothetical protein